MTLPNTSTPAGPLAGVRVIELGGIGPGPFAGMILADLGAEVVRVDRPAEHGMPSPHPILHRSRRSVTADLKNPRGIEVVLKLIDGADALIEGFRPGVTERLGLGPEVCLERNARLVYGRMTGWGQDGPLAQAPGHDINYIAVAGALAQVGPADGDPVVPLNLFGDMGGGGMLLALGISAALYSARTTGRGQVVDAAMTDGTAIQLALLQGLLRTGRWTEGRGSNLFDGAAPFYRTYRCADGAHMAIGCVEPQFYAETLRILGLTDDPVFAEQNDREAWPRMSERLAALFATRTRDAWAAEFEGSETCVTPVLNWTEAATHPHNAGRGTFRLTDEGYPEPGTAPRFLGTPSGDPVPAGPIGGHTEEVLAELGVEAAELRALRERGVVG
ncbi:CaiB/BaiF CoA-transferase family protein [Streptomyces sp. NPDC005236]|uniref:CaiB/BaiF CoA transferase family protein n=1 Tax=Streptomyces sp. NPDC005236 TaxID=3157028 RepID=UPI0033A45338